MNSNNTNPRDKEKQLLGADPFIGLTERLAQFAQRYQSHFKSLTRNVAQVAGHYLKGLFQSHKKNMERMEEMAPEADEQRLQHFLSESPWDEQAVMEQVAKGADTILGGKADSSLIVDESAFTKKGTHSVGVARQYNGRMGKVDNCQVGVFSALSSGTQVCPVGTRLFLPAKWTRNRKRCRKAGVPQQRFKHQTKQELALELAIQSAQRYWIERSFEDGKGKVGMGDCQARGWVCWHHHIAMVMMAMLFLLEERQYNQSAMPLISCTDVVELLFCALPNRKGNIQELLRQIKLRHEKRQASIDAAYAKQRAKKLSGSGGT